MGQLHDVGLLNFVQQLEHLLLAVAGGLTHHQVGEVEVGAGIGQGKTVAGLDQGTQVPGQIGLGGGDGLIGEGAQTHGQSAGGIDQLDGNEGAEHADDLGTLVLQFLHAQEAGLPGLRVGLKICRQIQLVVHNVFLLFLFIVQVASHEMTGLHLR